MSIWFSLFNSLKWDSRIFHQSTDIILHSSNLTGNDSQYCLKTHTHTHTVIHIRNTTLPILRMSPGLTVMTVPAREAITTRFLFTSFNKELFSLDAAPLTSISKKYLHSITIILFNVYISVLSPPPCLYIDFYLFNYRPTSI